MLDESGRERLRQLLFTFCTKEEAAAAMGLSPEELEREAASFFDEFDGEVPTYKMLEERYFAIGRARLRSAQFSAALDGDRSMLLALGREYLGQGSESAKEQTETKEGTLLALVQGKYADAADRKSRAAN